MLLPMPPGEMALGLELDERMNDREMQCQVGWEGSLWVISERDGKALAGYVEDNAI